MIGSPRRGRKIIHATPEQLDTIRADRAAGVPFEIIAGKLGRCKQWVIDRAVDDGCYTQLQRGRKPATVAQHNRRWTPERAEAGAMPLPAFHPLAVRELGI